MKLEAMASHVTQLACGALKTHIDRKYMVLFVNCAEEVVELMSEIVNTACMETLGTPCTDYRIPQLWQQQQFCVIRWKSHTIFKSNANNYAPTCHPISSVIVISMAVFRTPLEFQSRGVCL